MLSRKSKLLVIDASVAGPRPLAANADLRREILDICHRVVMTPTILGGWQKHATRSARYWHQQMVSRKKIVALPDPRDEELRSKLDASFPDDRDREAAQKDAPLIEAAMVADGIIVSCDEKARRLFEEASKHVGALRNIVWINPERSTESDLKWLRRGAPSEKRRKLGARQGKGRRR